ncbi:MAG: bifunctional alpha/beta hydrolase/class I SAM-dependent methyltransferase [Gammaproteobacteria bacterium]
MDKRACTEHEMSSWDGARLFYRAWLPATATDRAIVLFHRGHEHSARLQDVVDKLALSEIAMFAWDQRGHGHSPGERGYAPSFGCLVRDVDAFVRHIADRHAIPLQNMVVVAQSVGSVLAAAWVRDYAPPIRALVVASPALRVRLYVPFAIPGLRLLLKFKPKAFIKSYVKSKLLTHDPAKQADYDRDPLISPAIAVNILVGLYDAGTRLMADSRAIITPTLMLTSGADWVVEQKAQHRFFDGLGSPIKEKQVFPGFFHDTLNEKDSHLPLGKAREFIRARFAEPFSQPAVLDADRRGYTYAEYERLRQPLPGGPRAWFFSVARWLMHGPGRISEGIRIGADTGFDSGSTLDYVYRNRAQGRFLIGRLIDRAYLDSIGWRGIRQRKIHLEAALNDAIARLVAAGKAVHIVDIATGHGRYVLDVLRALKEVPATALLRDYSPLNIEAGQALARELGLANVVYQQGDAFSAQELARLDPAPTIAIASGLYELFPDNAPVMRSLAGLAAHMAAGSLLIVTNQPWHPQLEFIAHALTSHRDGKPWVMRRRTQAEMDQLLRQAGFAPIAQSIDEWGIFAVILAERRGAV